MERRLAAILAADVVGYSRLMGLDEAGTLNALNAHRSELIDGKIAEHRGRVVKLTGDGMLVEFPSVVNAVACSADIQRGMFGRNEGVPEDRRIVLRIGINLGDVIVEGDDIFGDGVNVAARLEGIAKPGGIAISASVRDQIGDRLALAFADVGEQTLKNITQPVRVFEVRWDEGPETATPSSHPAGPMGLPDKPSLAVLPFANMSSDPEQEYFADGLAEDLITDLSKVPGLMVIARNSSFVFKGRAVDIRSVANDLHVRYVVEGSVRRASGRVRINTQLIDANDNSHVWADRFDGELADIFALQDEVVRKIVEALKSVLPFAPHIDQRRSANIEAYELFVQGRAIVFLSAEGNRRSRALFERSIALDPGFAEVHAWLSMSHIFGWMHWGEGVEHRALAVAAARTAVALDPRQAVAHSALAYVLMFDSKLEEAAREYATAFEVNPNFADAWAFAAELKLSQGLPEEGIEYVRTALRLNPHAPGWYFWILGMVLYGARRYEEAVEALQNEATYGSTSGRLLAASLAQLGRIEEAKAEARKFLALNPVFSAARWAEGQPFHEEAARQHFVEGYLKAGLPM